MTGIPSSLPTNVGLQSQNAGLQNSQQQAQQARNEETQNTARSEQAPVTNQANDQQANPVFASNADNSSTNATEQRGSLIDIEV